VEDRGLEGSAAAPGALRRQGAQVAVASAAVSALEAPMQERSIVSLTASVGLNSFATNVRPSRAAQKGVLRQSRVVLEGFASPAPFSASRARVRRADVRPPPASTRIAMATWFRHARVFPVAIAPPTMPR
jgi:hypothetical protein